MDEGDDADPGRHGAREERLTRERLEGCLGEEERDGRGRQSARQRLGRFREADRGQDEEGGGQSGAAPVGQEVG
jgi:hypothetical protein